jgi:phage shock protein E
MGRRLHFHARRSGDGEQQELMQQAQNNRGMLLIDVRTPGEFSAGHVPGAINIPHTELAKRLDEIRPYHDKGVILYCESGRRAGMAEGILRDAGLDNIRHLEGDMAAWRQSGLPVEK